MIANIILGVAMAVVFGAAALAGEFEPPAPGSYKLPVIKAAGDGEVIDVEKRRLKLGDLTRGRITVMSFIYTRCAAARACPYATGVLRELHAESQKDAQLAERMRLLSLSFDPVGDTPEKMAAYAAIAKTDRPAAEWRFLTTRSQRELAPILEAYGQAVDKRRPNDPAGPLNHILRVFLIDGEGKVRNIYSSATLDPRLVLADVRTLILEGGPRPK